MPEGAIVSMSTEPKFLDAVVTSEKVGDRESRVLEADIRSSAPSKRWRVLVDLNQVTLLASMGLGALVNLHKACNDNGGRLVVCSLKPDIASVLKLTHLDKILKIVPDREAARKLLS